jgi:predicted nucleic-acid-binding protein
MRAVDTNLLVRLLTRDDIRQTRAAEAFIKPGAWVSHLVLVETLWVLDTVYELTHDQLTRVVEMLLEHESLSVQDSDVATSALDLYRGRPSIGFSDCLILETARKAGHLPLGTFDKGLSRLEGAERVG